MNHEFSIDGLFDFLTPASARSTPPRRRQPSSKRMATRTALRVLPGSWLREANIIPPATALPSWHGGCPRAR